MKELYSFDVKREVKSEVPHIKKTKDGPVETTKRVTKTIKNRIVFIKPTIVQREEADFFYGQKFNELINAGFLTKAMLAKKMGDLGGITSKSTSETVSEIVLENIDAARTIEFFGGSESLNEEQSAKLKKAEKTFAETKKTIFEYEISLRDQFGQTADAKAEQKLIEWLVLNFSYYEDKVKDKDRTQLFPIFQGESYKSKRNLLLLLQEDEEDEVSVEDTGLSEIDFLKLRKLYEAAFDTLIKVSSIWYNQLGKDQESIQKSLDDLFEEDEPEEKQDKPKDKFAEEDDADHMNFAWA